jgi:hypothetical protein
MAPNFKEEIMLCCVARHRRSWVPLVGITLLVLVAPVAHAQYPGYDSGYPYRPAVAPVGYYPAWNYQNPPWDASPWTRPAYYPTNQQAGYYPNRCYPSQCYPAPCYQVPAQPQAPAAPAPQAAPRQLPQAPGEPAPGAPPAVAPPAAAPPAQAQQPPATPSTDQIAQAPESGQEVGGGGAAFSATSYIDSAIPRTMVRIRGDAAFNDNRPDRAEFFYAKCGCFRTAPAPFTDPTAPGPGIAENRVNYQEIQTYLEYAATQRLSGFVEVPVRFVEFKNQPDTQGLSDINFGFKAAVIADCNRYLTFQLKTYLPSGAASQGLGTHHPTVEPGILFYQGIGDRARIETEVRDWCPFEATDFAGNVLRYGVGFSYDVLKTCKWSLSPVVETVGWTVFDGKELDATTGATKSAAGDTIVNAKAGLRWTGEHISMSASYGRALTGAVWYKDIARLEIRYAF